ncbi:MAG: hypothetical protein JXA53_01685 [Bacteroidales bacterium]|nr:hypothetical protein [Bacteroidales bacterium]
MNKLFTLLILCFICSCTNRASKLQEASNNSEESDKLYEELNNSTVNAEKFHELTNLTDDEISKFSDDELVDLAVELYSNVGGSAYFKEDSLKLIKALSFLNVAIEKNCKNEAAYLNKVSIHVSFSEYTKAISDIKSLFKVKGEYAEGLMYIGLLYETLNVSDSSNIFYQKALDSFNKRIKSTNNLNDKISRSILHCLLKDNNIGIDEINKIIAENPDNDFVKQIKTNVIDNFDRLKFVKEAIR